MTRPIRLKRICEFALDGDIILVRQTENGACKLECRNLSFVALGQDHSKSKVYMYMPSF